MSPTNVIVPSAQCDSLRSSASTETTGIETPELSMVLEKAAGKMHHKAILIYNIHMKSNSICVW